MDVFIVPPTWHHTFLSVNQEVQLPHKGHMGIVGSSRRKVFLRGIPVSVSLPLLNSSLFFRSRFLLTLQFCCVVSMTVEG